MNAFIMNNVPEEIGNKKLTGEPPNVFCLNNFRLPPTIRT